MTVPERPRYRVVLRPEPAAEPVQALRRLLKYALRVCRMRCVSVEEVADEIGPDRKDEG